ncbi:MAG: exonuclease domain-containing protein, partial [Mycoplasma sp.]
MNKLIKIATFLNILNNNEILELNNLKILDYKQKQLIHTFSVLLDKPLSPAVFNKIKLFKYDDIEIKTSVIGVSEIQIEDIYKYLDFVYENNQDLKFYKNLIDRKGIDFDSISSTLIFNYQLDDEKQEVDLVVKKILELIKQAFGLPVINFEMNYNNDLEQLQQHKEEFIKKNINEAISDYQNKKKIVIDKKDYKVESKKIVPLIDVLEGMYNITVQGEIFKIEKIDNTKLTIFKISITDYDSTLLLTYRYFKSELGQTSSAKKINQSVFESYKTGDWIITTVDVKNDKYDLEPTGYIKRISNSEKPKRLIIKDDAPKKRIELTVHSKMSSFDGVSEVKDIVKFSKQLNNNVIALTDRFNVQSFPEFQKETISNNVKAIYGFEACMLPVPKCALNIDYNHKLNDVTYTIFDLETTGLYPNYDDIIEFGAVKYKNGVKIDSMQFFAKPNKPVSEFITSLTGITNNDLKDGVDQRTCIMKILDFIGDTTLVAHNAFYFDYNFLIVKAEKFLSQKVNNVVIDTLH